MMSQSKIEDPKKVAVASAAAQQSDNIAHALAGAGGGILSMILTCAIRSQSLPPPARSGQQNAADRYHRADTL